MTAPAPHRYSTRDIPVPGGSLRVGVWDPIDAVRGEVLAVHGVTSSHRVWAHTVAHLRGIRIVAPDLRGRGRSTAGQPAGLDRHADDLALVLAATMRRAPVVVGHSMGGFVSVVLAHRHPELVDSLLLVDGGLPLRAPEGLSAEETVAAILGPTAERLRMRFDDEAAYLRFWRAHPAFGGPWTPELEDYFRYDLVDSGDGSLRPATSEAVTIEDTVDLTMGSALPGALEALRHPTRMLTVPRGLRDEEPGLYPPDHLSALLAGRPTISHRHVAGFNHYSIVLTPEGGAVVAEETLAALRLRGLTGG